MTLTASCSLLLLAATLAGGAASGQDWPHWRGPRYDGSATASGLPTGFARDQRVRWATDLPGPAASTPIVIGERIFLSSVDTERERLIALCLARADGKVRWQKDADRPGDSGSRIADDKRSNYASPSPATDGERVFFFFGNGDLVAYDLDGEELWRQNIQQEHGDFAFQWTFSASPTVYEGRLFLPVLQRDVAVRAPQPRARGERRRGPREDAPPQTEQPVEPIESFVLVLDPATGKTLHKQVRPSPAQVESRESYGTMIPYVGETGRKELLLAGGDVITGHDAEDGHELWRWGTWNEGHREKWWRLVPSAVVGDGLALVCAPKNAPIFAVRLGGEGELDDSALIW